MASAMTQSGRPPGRTALGGRMPASTANPIGNEPNGDKSNGNKPGLVVSELGHLGKLNIRGGADILPAVKTRTGCTSLPGNNSFVAVGDRRLVWLAPDEFMLLCDAGSEVDIHNQLTIDFDSIHAAVTNVTDSLCALRLKGPALRQVLAKGCALDLHPSVFAAGQSAQTMLSHAAVTLIAESDDQFILICRTSFAAFVAAWLADAGMEYGVSFKS